jgi:hypothetical protein
VSTTHEEADAVRDWATRTHARSVIVPVEAFPSRRVRWTLTHTLAGTGTAVQIQVADYANYKAWSKTHAGLIAFESEVIKYLYCRYAY